jgi:hypothetical protein
LGARGGLKSRCHWSLMVSEARWNLVVVIEEPPMAVRDDSGRRWVLGVALWARGKGEVDGLRRWDGAERAAV